MRKRAIGFGPALRKAQDQIRSVVLEESRRIMAERIYGVPIPHSEAGRPDWVRTQELYNSEHVEIRGAVLTLRNSSGHAKQRRDLGTPAGKQIRSLGVQVVDWQREALHNTIGQIREFYHQMNQRIIRA